MGKLRKLVLAVCLFVAHANKEAYGNWETYLNKHDRTSEQGVETPYWKNYENWNQWVTEEAPADLTPSKNGLDSWRKWNLGKMDTYGENWQTFSSQHKKEENRRSELEQAPKQGTDEWKEWMKTRFVETNNLMSRPNHRVERDYPVAEKEKEPFGPYHHPKEVPDAKDPTNSNQDDWQEMIPAAYRGLMSSKQPTPEEEKARQDGDVNWRNYVPKGYRDVAPAWGIHDGVAAAPDNDFAERYNDKHSPNKHAPHHPPVRHHKDKDSNKDKDLQDFNKYPPKDASDWTKYGEEYSKKYTGDNEKYAEKYGEKPNESDWSKYIPSGAGEDNEKTGRRYADKYSGSGGDGNDISKYTDWKKYVGDRGGNDWNKYIPESPPGAGGGGDRSGGGKDKGPDGWENYGGGSYTDWKKFAGGYGPPMTLIAKPKHSADSTQPSSTTSENNQPVDWHKYVPESYRDFIPSDKTIDEANKNNAQGKPVDWRGFVPEAFRNYVPDDATIAEQEKSRKAEGPNHGPMSAGGNEESTTSTSTEVIIIESQPELDGSSAKIGSHIQGEQDKQESSSPKDKPTPTDDDHRRSSAKLGSKIQRRELPKKNETKKKCVNPKCGTECECDKNCECRKHTPPQSENFATSNLASVHSSPTISNWSGIAIGFLSVTILIGVFVGGYIFKRLKKRHYDYEQVAELDPDQLLLI